VCYNYEVALCGLIMIPLNKIISMQKELDQYRPFDRDILDNLERWFEVELTYTSNAIEGNTLTRLETALVLEKGITVGGKPLKDHLEAINHQNAISLMQQMVQTQTVSLGDILSIHHLILKGIDDVNAGQIRRVPVRISGSSVVLPNSLKVPMLLDEFMVWLQESKEHPVTLAALAHHKLVTIHPFVDGNGRTARLLMNLILMQHGYPPAIISPKERLAYIQSLEQSQLGGRLDSYLDIIYKAVIRSLTIYLKALRKERPERLTRTGALLKIGQLAKEANESSSTIRYWTKIGLLEVVTTTPSGYQLYDRRMVDQCCQIRDLQKQRYTLDEIATKFLSIDG